jgi:DNA-binding transcriptional MocR family regulator
VLSPGDKVACESPTFVGIRDVLAGVGAEVFAIPVDADGLDTTALEELLRRGDIRMVILQPRLHNPTANDLSAERRERLVELAVQHAFFILEDAVYADIRFAGEELGPLRAQAPAHVIYVDSLSKTVTPGLRFGWIAASGPVFDRLVAEKRRDDGQSATLAQMAIAAFLADGRYPQQLERTLGIYRERRDVIVDALAAHMADLASFSPPNGGGHIWVTLRRACDDEHLYHEALSAGVAFLPGRAMLIEREQATHLRLSYGLVEPAGLREGVRRLAAVVRSLADRLPEGHSLLVN